MSIIHINSHVARKNKKNKTREPAIAVRKTKSSKAEYADNIAILDREGNTVAVLGSHYDNPLQCGATIYIETIYETKLCK